MRTPKPIVRWVAALGAALLAGPPATAADKGGESLHLLSVGAGVSSPSFATPLLGENPAGLVYNERFKLHFFGSSESDDLDPLGYGVDALLGNGTVGGGIGFRSDTGPSSEGSLVAGIGFTLDSLALGAACGASLSDGVSVSCHDFGILYRPKESPRLGLQFDTETEGLGIGVAGEVAGSATLALDAGTSLEGGGVVVKPGVGIRTGVIHLSAGYGLGEGNGGGGIVDSGISLGVGVVASDTVKIDAYYNQVSKFFVGVVIGF